jgi:3-methyladenine DNA glycosylase AlkD
MCATKRQSRGDHTLSTWTSAAEVARAARAHLRRHGSAEHAAGAGQFFKEAVRSYGWYAADLRRYGRALHAELDGNVPLMLDAAELLFGGTWLEEKGLAVLVLERSLDVFGRAEFDRFEAWLDRVGSWADHDALAMCLLGPMMAADPRLVARTFVWARADSRWRRRAAAVSPIRGVRRGLFTTEATRLTTALLGDTDDMVQKGLGWLLREWSKVRPAETIPLLMEIRDRSPRLVLRTACETLPPADRARILERPHRTPPPAS